MTFAISRPFEVTECPPLIGVARSVFQFTGRSLHQVSVLLLFSTPLHTAVSLSGSYVIDQRCVFGSRSERVEKNTRTRQFVRHGRRACFCTAG